MAEDIFDVVDELDRPVGRAPRSQVHARKLLHRAVHILVFNKSGDLFLQKRSMAKDSHPGRWDSSASGHVDAGEDYMEAAVREVREEIGVAVASGELRFLGKLKASAETDQEFVCVYALAHEGPFVLHPQEIESGRFWEMDEIRGEIERLPGQFATAFKTIVREFLRA